MASPGILAVLFGLDRLQPRGSGLVAARPVATNLGGLGLRWSRRLCRLGGLRLGLGLDLGLPLLGEPLLTRFGVGLARRFGLGPRQGPLLRRLVLPGARFSLACGRRLGLVALLCGLILTRTFTCLAGRRNLLLTRLSLCLPGGLRLSLGPLLRRLLLP